MERARFPRFSGVFVAFLCGAWAAPALADEAAPVDDSPAPSVVTQDVRSEIPSLAYAYTAHGATAKSLGAMAYGLGVGAAGQKGILGGGVTVWGSPVERLTLVGDGQRNVFGNFSPSLAAVVRLLGRAEEGWSLGALGKFKVEGFGRPGGIGTRPATRTRSRASSRPASCSRTAATATTST